MKFSRGGDVGTTRRVGSLAARLLVAVAVPVVVASVFVVDSVAQQRDVEAAGVTATERVALFHDLAAMFGAVTTERVYTAALCAALDGGMGSATLESIVGYDVLPYLGNARASVDVALSTFGSDHGTLSLADGRSVEQFVEDAEASLADQRQGVDECTDGTAIDATLGSIVAVAEALRLRVTDDASATSATISLARLQERTSLLVHAVASMSDETRAFTSALIDSNSTAAAADLLRAGALADDALTRYATALQHLPDLLDAWSTFQSAPAIERFVDERRAFLDTVAFDQLNVVARSEDERAAHIRSAGHVFMLAVERLDAFVEYAGDELDAATTSADAMVEAARTDQQRSLALLVTGLVALGAFVMVTVVGTVRPLRRLAAQGRLLTRGESGSLLALSGPSEVREVADTFNGLVTTIRSYERELTRAAAGDDVDEAALASMAGSLGSSVRTSVARLANLTRQLSHSEALSSAIVETAADAIWTLDDHDRVVSANDAAERLVGLPRSRQIGAHLPTMLGGRVSCAELDGEIDLAHPKGTVTNLLVSRSTVPAEPHPVTTVFARDISDQKRFEQRLAFQARYDGLTGLPNRLAAFEHLDAALSQAASTAGELAVLFIDLDGFKSVNDSRGHSTGDRLLQVVARRLRSGLRHSEFIARLGGDEFLVVMEHAGVEAASVLGQRLLEHIALPFANDEDRFVISASIGIAVGAPGDVDSIELVRRADIAIYKAKEAGRARIAVFDETLQAAIEANAEVELALRSAIANNELQLYYQPAVNLADDRPWGAEVLLRWNRPGHGLVQPDRFIPVAERSSLILDFGRWVLLEACHKLALWQARSGRNGLRLAVNISGRHLAEGDLIGDVDAALAATGADPTFLEIELTETHLLADLNHTNEILDVLRAKGIGIAVDDFGTGYSSMTYLRQLHIDAIKMDRSFISRVEHSGYDRTIVDIILQLGHTLHLEVVAEGIETPEQLAILRQQGCDRAQGYLFARPMPIDHFEEWLVDVWSDLDVEDEAA